MSNKTDKLGLFKWDITDEQDLSSEFDIEEALNKNWDKIDEEAKNNEKTIQNLKEIIKYQSEVIEQAFDQNEKEGNVVKYDNTINAKFKEIHVLGSTPKQNNISSFESPQEIMTVTGTNNISIVNKNRIKIPNIYSQGYPNGGIKSGLTYNYNEEQQTITINGTCLFDNTRIELIKYLQQSSVSKQTTLIVELVSGNVTGYAYLRNYTLDWNNILNIDLTALTSSAPIKTAVTSASGFIQHRNRC